jgi:protein involved in temperature-dependent protein secretion
MTPQQLYDAGRLREAVAAATEADDRLRLGRMTDWRGGDGTPVRGFGQRVFAVGGEARTVLEMHTVAFNPPGP